jgi:hypothetical protein
MSRYEPQSGAVVFSAGPLCPGAAVSMIRRVSSRCLVTTNLLVAPGMGASPVHSRVAQHSANRTPYSRFAG